LQWHLTDDQGWRIEIKKWPKLTTVGAWRGSGAQRHGGFYTQEDIREIVAYAAERHITIVPEIEMPGHATAALAAYPELGNTDIPNYKRLSVETRWGVIPTIFSPKEEMFAFVEDVVSEVAALFPSKYIHTGGDEAPKSEWQKSPFAQSVIRKHGLKNEHQLQAWFVRRVEKIYAKHDRKLIGWDEIQEGGLSKSATMMVWRNWKWARYALDRGNDIIMTPTSHCYLDYDYRAIPLKKSYLLNPIPAGTRPEQIKQILGVQGNGWGVENTSTWEKMQWHLFPRAIALAEVGWTLRENKSWEDFSARLPIILKHLDALKIKHGK
jgi:hexosaminidase